MIEALLPDLELLVVAWYRWGVAGGVAISVVTTLWVFFDSQRQSFKATFWRLVSLLAAMMVVPSAVFSLFPELAVGLGELPALLAYLGIAATLISFVTLILYTAGVGVHVIEEEVPLEEDTLASLESEELPQPAPDETQVMAATPPPGDAQIVAPTQATIAVTPDPFQPQDDKTREPDAESSKPLPLAWMVVMSGREAGKDYRVGELADIGRDSRYNNVSIEDPAMSRQHARLRFEQGEYILYDLASANGVAVNGQKEQRQPVNNGDRITIGHTVFGFMMVDEQEDTSSEA